MYDLSWLNPTPRAIAVYASQPLSPAATQHSLPSGRYSLLGPDLHRQDRTSFAWRTYSINFVGRACVFKNIDLENDFLKPHLTVKNWTIFLAQDIAHKANNLAKRMWVTDQPGGTGRTLFTLWLSASEG